MDPEDQIRMLMQEIEMLKAQLRDERVAEYQAARSPAPPPSEDFMAAAPEWARPKPSQNKNFKVMPHKKRDETPGRAYENTPYIRKEQKPGRTVGLL